jgi:hypothetical protein
VRLTVLRKPVSDLRVVDARLRPCYADDVLVRLDAFSRDREFLLSIAGMSSGILNQDLCVPQRFRTVPLHDSTRFTGSIAVWCGRMTGLLGFALFTEVH